MLYSVDSMKYVTTLPHGKDYDNWKNHISDADYDKVVDALTSLLMQKKLILLGGCLVAIGMEQCMNLYIMLVEGKNQTQAGMFLD